MKIKTYIKSHVIPPKFFFTSVLNEILKLSISLAKNPQQRNNSQRFAKNENIDWINWKVKEHLLANLANAFQPNKHHASCRGRSANFSSPKRIYYLSLRGRAWKGGGLGEVPPIPPGGIRGDR
jgi:hypothetical protein